MSRSKPPLGFSQHTLPCGVAWLRTQWQQHITRAVATSTQSIISLAQQSPKSIGFRGRGAVATWNHSSFPNSLVVRRCTHGGLWRHVAGDRYVGTSRAQIEIENAQTILNLGMLTPEIVGVVFYNAGLFMRMDLITVRVESSEDLVDFLASQPSHARRLQALEALRTLLEQCARGGLMHHDLNARNILLADAGELMRAYVLDVEDISWRPHHFTTVQAANFSRLSRSLFKRAQRGDLPMSAEAVAQLLSELESPT